MAPNSTAVCQSLYSTFKWALLREVKRKNIKKKKKSHKAKLKVRNPTGFFFLKHSQKNKNKKQVTQMNLT